MWTIQWPFRRRSALASRSSSTRPWKRKSYRPSLDMLEDRTLLASGFNSFGLLSGELTTSTERDVLAVDLRRADFTLPAGRLLLGVSMNPLAGSSVNPAAIGVTPGLTVLRKANTTDVSSLTLVQLKPQTLAVKVRGTSGTGAYKVDFFLAGDANGDFRVDAEDLKLIRSLYGKRFGRSGYLLDADVNRDKVINVTDRLLAKRNLGVSTVLRPPTINATVATTVAASTQFLYSGLDPVQTGVAPGTIEPLRAAVLRGKVKDRYGSPLAGVEITILNHPELGVTHTQADGTFSMAVNGGQMLTVNYRQSGLLDVQRQVDAPWQDYTWAPDVVMIPQDSQVTAIDLTSGTMQVARGSPVTDTDGTRQATVLFPAGVQASMVLPNGSTAPLITMHLTITEYGAGRLGRKALPADLPPGVAYAYAAEFRVDEAQAAGASGVRFSQPLPFYVEDFLNLPVGTAVPQGYYDRAKAQWLPSPNGRVLRVLGTSSGVANLDLDGSGQPVSDPELAALGITLAERQQLALLYQPGQILLRMPLLHFSTDTAAPQVGSAPSQTPTPPNQSKPGADDCCDGGQFGGVVHYSSTINTFAQVVDEAEPVTGTRFQLHYTSARAPGRRSAYMLQIPLTGANVDPDLSRIDLEVDVAGEHYQQSFSPQADQTKFYTWDGKDGFGRFVQGAQRATVTVTYVYPAGYASPTGLDPAFGDDPASPSSLVSANGRDELRLPETWQVILRTWNAQLEGLGGWSLDVHHSYDLTSRVLYRGDGGVEKDLVASVAVTTAAGTGSAGFGGDDGPATQAEVQSPQGVAVGPDGSVYIADTLNHVVRRVGPDGTITTVAGTGIRGFSGDGGPATAADLEGPVKVAVASDGSLYIADRDPDNPLDTQSRIRRVAADGTITTFAGTGIDGPVTGGIPATQANLTSVSGVAVAPDGTVYITANQAVIPVGPDGLVKTVLTVDSSVGYSDPAGIAVGPDGGVYFADRGLSAVYRLDAWGGGLMLLAGNGTGGDGGPAVSAALNDPEDVAVGADGTVFLAEAGSHRIRQISPDGIINTIVGTDTGGTTAEGAAGKRTTLQAVQGLAVGPDGILYYADAADNRIRRAAPAYPGVSANEFFIPSSDGSEVYVFDHTGQHLRTLDALTGVLRYQFGYNAQGRLITVTDANDNVTRIERDANGNPTAVVAPGGQRTVLTLNADGYLASIRDPSGATVQLSYERTFHPPGLLAGVTDARGNVHHYDYDYYGKVDLDQDAAGGSLTLTRTDQGTGHTVTVATGAGVKRRYTVEYLPNGDKRFTTTDGSGFNGDGLKTVTEIHSDGSIKMTTPDGTVRTEQYSPDPRFGMLAPVLSTLTIAPPGGPTFTMSESRTANLGDPNDPLSLTSLTDAVTVNGNTFTTTYNAAAHTLTSSTPLGLQSIATLDAKGHVISDQEPGQTIVQYVYDTRGRLFTITQGTRTTTLTYNDANDLTGITDPLAHTVHFAYDLAGRPTTQTLPDGHVIQFTYDVAGNISSVTPPGRPSHSFSYTATNSLQAYTPPDVGAGTNATHYSYNLDQQLKLVERPDGTSVNLGYDSAGRLNTLTDTVGITSWSYYPTSGLLKTIAAPGSTLAYVYTGSLLTDITWAGDVGGTVYRTYDNYFRLAGESVDGGNAVSFTYNQDGALTGAGNLSLTYAASTGQLTGTTLGTITDSYTYDNFGHVTGYQATAASTGLFTQAYTLDALGRITQKVETIGGATHTYNYAYDLQGRLTQVQKDGAVVVTYAYDANGNRLSLTTPIGTFSSTYDAQDRLTQYGIATYAYTANGELQSKTVTLSGQTTSYAYDALGNLRSVTLPDGTQITYVIDGQNRRIGKKVNGTLVQGFLYDGSRLVAELNGAGQVVSRFVYAPGGTVPLYMIKGGVTYRILTDQVGSPRLVVNSATGAIMQRLDYDEFGNVRQDTNPGFQPFGFAGGLYDRDTRLIRFGARDYDPGTGRWTAKDPIRFAGDETNLYVYAANDAVNGVDPVGLYVAYVDPRLQGTFAQVASTSTGRSLIEAINNSPIPVSIEAGPVYNKNGTRDAGYTRFIPCGSILVTIDVTVLSSEFMRKLAGGNREVETLGHELSHVWELSELGDYASHEQAINTGIQVHNEFYGGR